MNLFLRRSAVIVVMLGALVSTAGSQAQPKLKRILAIGETRGWHHEATSTALTMVYQPLFTVLLFCPIVVLHRSVLVKELEAAATIDVKTGLLNAALQAHRSRHATEWTTTTTP